MSADIEKTLRDEFAMAAMRAEVTARQGLGMLTERIAQQAYTMADAMLAARALSPLKEEAS